MKSTQEQEDRLTELFQLEDTVGLTTSESEEKVKLIALEP